MSKSDGIGGARSLSTLRERLRSRRDHLEAKLLGPGLLLTTVSRIQGELHVLRMTLASVEAQLRRKARVA